MARTLLLIGARKGLFTLESDEERRDWALRGPLCESWPVYHAVYDQDSGATLPRPASGMVRRSGGAAISAIPGRSRARGSRTARATSGRFRRWRRSPRRTVACSSVRRHRASSRAGTAVRRFPCSPPLRASREVEHGTIPPSQPPGHLGISAIMADADDASHFWTIVQGVGIFETDDGGTSWTPRNKGLRADWPRTHDEVGFCVHRLVRSQADPNRMYQQNHVGVHRSDDGGHSSTRSRTACRASSASPPLRTRTTATRST